MHDWDDDGFTDVHDDGLTANHDGAGSGAHGESAGDPAGPSLGIAFDVDGQTEAGNPVAWSTAYDEYYDTGTGNPVEPK